MLNCVRVCVCVRAAQIELLHALAGIANENNLGEGITVKIKFNIIASLYDYNPNLSAFMKVRGFVCSFFCSSTLHLIVLYSSRHVRVLKNCSPA